MLSSAPTAKRGKRTKFVLLFMVIRAVFPALLAALLSPVVNAQLSLQPTWLFERHAYYDPLSSEPRAASTKVMFPARSSSVPYAQHPGQSMVWDISVGDEIPVAGWSTSSVHKEGDATPAGSFSLAFYFPLSFHMVEDLGKDDSNPILNTDYRFGSMVKAQWGLKEKLGHAHFGVRYVPIAHESTHLGDEFTLHATQIFGNNFQRVNVSYQYWELGGSFEPNFLADDRLQTKFRGGLIHESFHKGIGWYDSALIQPVGGTVTLSKRNIEPYLGAEIFLTPADIDQHKYGPFLSLDVRDRTVYGYNRPSQAIDEATEVSVNALIGYKHVQDGARIRPSYYLRYYHGVNPAGQFRSQDNYQLYGFGILLEF